MTEPPAFRQTEPGIEPIPERFELPAPQVVVTFSSPGVQRAFADWVASGEALRHLWAWMGRHSYHA